MEIIDLILNLPEEQFYLFCLTSSPEVLKSLQVILNKIDEVINAANG